MSEFRPGRSPARPAGGKRSVQSIAARRAAKPEKPEVPATDAAKARADQNDVDLTAVEHTGEEVTQADVEATIETEQIEPELEPVSSKVAEAEAKTAPAVKPPATKTTPA